MARQIGTRVGAILSGKNGVVEFLGYGTYVGDQVPEEAVGPMAEVMREVGGTNPKIELDSGKVVYGCECWWGGEEAVKKQLTEFNEVIEVDIDEIRESYRKRRKP